MFLDPEGNPIEITVMNQHEYKHHLHGVMLLTSAAKKLFIPPNWRGLIISTGAILFQYNTRFKPDKTYITYHILEPYEPQLICCEKCVVEISALPAGHVETPKGRTEVTSFLLVQDGFRTLITKELNVKKSLFPGDHVYQQDMFYEGINMMCFDAKLYQKYKNQKYYVHKLIEMYTPKLVRSLDSDSTDYTDYLYQAAKLFVYWTPTDDSSDDDEFHTKLVAGQPGFPKCAKMSADDLFEYF